MLTTQMYERLFHQIIDLAEKHTDGRLLLTLGGGYRFDATVRIWAMLYLVANGLTLPDELPADWCTTWEDRLGEPLSSTLHDPPQAFDVPRHDTIVEQNRRVSKRLMEMIAPLWY
jgi:acetoin utilization protein AcuC